MIDTYSNYLSLVVGCPDPDLSMKTVLKIDENEATVGCKYGPSQTTWVLKCVQGKWLGDTGTCNSATINGSGYENKTYLITAEQYISYIYCIIDLHV